LAHLRLRVPVELRSHPGRHFIAVSLISGGDPIPHLPNDRGEVAIG
jgi:hypothetical protein